MPRIHVCMWCACICACVRAYIDTRICACVRAYIDTRVMYVCDDAPWCACVQSLLGSTRAQRRILSMCPPPVSSRCVCGWVCLNLCDCVIVCVCVYVRVRACVRVRARISVCTRAHTYTCTRMYAYLYACVHACVYSTEIHVPCLCTHARMHVSIVLMFMCL